MYFEPVPPLSQWSLQFCSPKKIFPAVLQFIFPVSVLLSSSAFLKSFLPILLSSQLSFGIKLVSSLVTSSYNLAFNCSLLLLQTNGSILFIYCQRFKLLNRFGFIDTAIDFFCTFKTLNRFICLVAFNSNFVNTMLHSQYRIDLAEVGCSLLLAFSPIFQSKTTASSAEIIPLSTNSKILSFWFISFPLKSVPSWLHS